MVSASIQVNAQAAYAGLEFVKQQTVLLINLVGNVLPTPHPVFATMECVRPTLLTLHQRGSFGL